MVEARNFKFGMNIDEGHQRKKGKLGQKGRGRGHVNYF